MSGAFFGGRQSQGAARQQVARDRRRDGVERDLERLKNELVGFARASPDAALFADWI